MKRWSLLLGCLGALAGAIGITTVAHAGMIITIPRVVIDLPKRTASGQLGDARRAPDEWSAIEIAIIADPKGRYAEVSFYDEKGTGAVCRTSAEPMVQTFATAPSDARLLVRWEGDPRDPRDGGDAVCTAVEIRNGSPYTPKS
jgi:hypothetical protein